MAGDTGTRDGLRVKQALSYHNSRQWSVSDKSPLHVSSTDFFFLIKQGSKRLTVHATINRLTKCVN